MRTKLLTLLLFFTFSAFILSPFLTDQNVITKNDMNGNIVPLLYFKDSILIHHSFPQWNPYLNQGIPDIADPLFGVFNPLISLPILLFPYQLAIKIIYLLSIFLACTGAYALLKRLNISPFVSIVTSLTYASSSYLYARIDAGHLEKVVSFGFLPLLIYCIFQIIKSKNLLWSGLGAITLSMILFSGDIYNALYSLYIIGAIGAYFFFKDKNILIRLMMTVALFFLFSSIKEIPMLELQGYISKIKEPFLGSQNILSTLYYIFAPFDSLWSKILPTQFFLNTSYGWWENLAFIGPFSILGLLFLPIALRAKKIEGKLIIILSALFLLLSMPGSRINPFEWIISRISFLQYFHVPSRIFAFWDLIILLSFSLLLDKWKKRKLALTLLIINLLFLVDYSQNVLTKQKFDPLRNVFTKPLKQIATLNKSNFFTVNEYSQGDLPQDQAYLNHLLMLQSNYGLFLRNSPSEKYNFKGDSKYLDISPGFLISDNQINDASLNIVNEYRDKKGKVFLYQNRDALPFARIGTSPQKVNFEVNKFSLTAFSKSDKKLGLLESKYPGWSVFIDGKKSKFLSGRFLEVRTLPGRHRYEFRYSSETFRIGASITFLSLFAWLFLVIRNNRGIIRKKWLRYAKI